MGAEFWIRAGMALCLAALSLGFGLTEPENSYIVDTSAGLIFTGNLNLSRAVEHVSDLTFQSRRPREI